MTSEEIDTLISLLQKLKPHLKELHAPNNVIHSVTSMRIATKFAHDHIR
jgi:hypothetical protein